MIKNMEWFMRQMNEEMESHLENQDRRLKYIKHVVQTNCNFDGLKALKEEAFMKSTDETITLFRNDFIEPLYKHYETIHLEEMKIEKMMIEAKKPLKYNPFSVLKR